jgi:Bacterial Ig-like domain (group 2)
MRRGVGLAGLALLAVLAQSCGSTETGSSPTSPTGATVGSVVVSGSLQPLMIGQTVQLTATANYTDGTSRNVTAQAVWESSNPSVAAVNGGSVTGIAEGAAAIVARFGGKDGNQGITVQPNPPPPPPNPGLACGVERWFVKTLADPDAATVNLSSVTPISIRDLNGLSQHCSGLPDGRGFAEEFRVFEVVGNVTYIAHEDDRDYHIALEDPNASGFSVVTEMADTMCSGAASSPHLATLRSVEGMFVTLLGGRSPSTLLGTTVRVQGVGFYDFNHGQRGRSANCIELHPIISISR